MKKSLLTPLWITLVLLATRNDRVFAQEPVISGERPRLSFSEESGQDGKRVFSGESPTVKMEEQGAGDGKAGEGKGAGDSKTGEGKGLSDLTLSNFFSAGWNEEWAKRQRATGTPDFALLRVQTNFLEREFRADYFFENNIHSAARKDLNSFQSLIAWGFNRRFMIEVLGNYQWIDARKGMDLDGGSPSLVGRVQLVDTESSSYSFNFRAVAPNTGIGEHQTTLSYGLAGFEDLACRLHLDRVGLYYSFLFDSLAGPREPGARQNDVAYDITLAKTLTAPETPCFGSFTVFVEHFAQTDLDGDHAGRTLVSITPGVRFNLGKSDRVKFGKDNWLLFGVDIPVAGPKPWDAIYRVSYIKNF